MKITSLTDIGVMRKDNQDNYWCSRLDVDGTEAGVMCLCDGMGGLDNGALASRIVVERVREYFLKNIDFKGLERVIGEANKVIHDMPKEGKKLSGTTCTVILCIEGVYKIYHVGDSRCYKISETGVELLTEDHSVVNKYKKLGVELSDDLKEQYKNSLTRCVGVEKNVSLDYIEGSYTDGDIFVVCSDGLWHYFDTHEVGYLNDLNLLITKCIEDGEKDNITIGVLEI